MTNKNTQIALIDPNDARLAQLDEAAKAGQLAAGESSAFRKMILMANGVAQLRALLTDDIMTPIMALQGTALGFRTDKDSAGGYPLPVVRDCVIEATLRGLTTTGNEFNIIAGRFYATKEGFGRLLANIPGLRYMITPGIPKTATGGAIAPVTITWDYRGNKNEKIIEFPIRVNAGMGADAINGKATRKARAWLYAQVTGMELADADVEDAARPPRNVTPGRFEPTTPFDENTAPPASPADLVNAEDEIAERLRAGDMPVTVDDIKAWCAAQRMPFDADRIEADLPRVASMVADWKNSK